MDINRPDILAEVEAAFALYEAALVSNDVTALGALFWRSEHTIRYGTGENLYGADFATASTLFSRETVPGKIGRQMQTWVRTPDGWRVVAAHVSLIDA